MAHENDFEENAYTDYTTIRDDTLDWRKRTDKMRKYYFGNQFSSSMSDKYKARGWTDIVINKVRPLIRSKISKMVAGKPQGKLFGYSAEDMTTAFALNELLDYHYDTSEGQMQFEDGAIYQLREGVGYWILIRDWEADYGRGELKFISESFENVFVRKSSRQWDYTDAGRVIHSRLTDKSDIEFRLNKYLSGINLGSFLHPYDIPEFSGKTKDSKQDVIGTPHISSGGNRYIREFDVYDRIHEDIQAIHYIPTNTILPVDKNYTPNKEENRLIKDGIIRLDQFKIPRIKYTKFIGNGTNSKRIGKQEILPIEFFPIIPIHNERTGNACSLGETHFFYGSQEMLNHSAALMIMNAALGSLFKVILDTRKYKGDVKQFKEQWASLGGVVNLESDPETGKFPIEVIRPDQISSAFWTMTQYFSAELEYESQSSPIHWGTPTKQSPDTLPPLLALNEWSDNSLRLHLNHFELAVERLYTVLLQWSKSFYGYKPFNVERDGENITNFVNSKIPLDTGFKTDKGIRILSRNNIKQLRARYKIKLGSTKPAPTQQYLKLYQELSAQYPIFLKYMIKYMDIDPNEKKELMDALDIVKQQEVKISQLTESLQTLGKYVRREMEKNIQLQQEHKVTQVAHRAEKQAVKDRADAKIAIDEAKNRSREDSFSQNK